MSTTTSALPGEPGAAPEAISGAVKAGKPSKAAGIMAAVAALAVAAGAGWYVTHRGVEATDDAQIDAEVVSVPARAAGVVVKVFFAENQAVKAGDVLAELDAEPARARLAQAEASLSAARASADAADADERIAETNARSNKSVAEASLHGAASSASASKQQIAEGEAQVASTTATLEQATLERDRARKLVETGALAQAQLDQLQASVDVARASLEQAKARLAALRATTTQAWSRVEEANAKVQQASNVDAFIAQARARARVAHAQVETAQAARDLAALELSYTRIVAPQDGAVSKKTLSVGQMVSPGQAVGVLVPARQVWVTGNFKETQLAHMRVGQPARMSIDAYPGVTVHGEIESFSAATGARFSLLPPDNATGNFTKVVQRVPVRIRLHDAPPDVVLRPGMSVELTVDTRQ
ncbi:HlyD family secretion protein [Sorangium sp. So ce281]|uniref:HlyD family secretion protein n=1 Tax=unclassified Sorangium TaxID=2621164 RepID=UPI003F620E22